MMFPLASIVLLCTPQIARLPDSHTEPVERTNAALRRLALLVICTLARTCV